MLSTAAWSFEHHDPKSRHARPTSPLLSQPRGASNATTSSSADQGGSRPWHSTAARGFECRDGALGVGICLNSCVGLRVPRRGVVSAHSPRHCLSTAAWSFEYHDQEHVALTQQLRGASNATTETTRRPIFSQQLRGASKATTSRRCKATLACTTLNSCVGLRMPRPLVTHGERIEPLRSLNSYVELRVPRRDAGGVATAAQSFEYCDGVEPNVLLNKLRGASNAATTGRFWTFSGRAGLRVPRQRDASLVLPFRLSKAA